MVLNQTSHSEAVRWVNTSHWSSSIAPLRATPAGTDHHHRRRRHSATSTGSGTKSTTLLNSSAPRPRTSPESGAGVVPTVAGRWVGDPVTTEPAWRAAPATRAASSFGLGPNTNQAITTK